jgi:hypothetical protein
VTAHVNVVDPPIFYVHSEENGGVASVTFNVVGANGTDGGAAVSCFGTDAGSYGSTPRYSAMSGTDWWEAPAGQASKLVLVMEERADGGASTVLAATTSNATCATPPVKLDTADVGATGTDRAFEQPRLSPSGARVAYVRATPDGARVATVGSDGAAPHRVAALGAWPDGGASPEAGLAPSAPSVRPVWVNETSVAWLQVLDGDHWQIVSAPDQEGATATLMMSCTGVAPNQFDLLPSGEVLVSQQQGAGPAAATNLHVYSVTPGTKECVAARNLSGVTSTNGLSFAGDFSLSPDKSVVAYKTMDDTTNASVIRVVKVDGTGTPTTVATPLEGAYRGPRWVGGGAYLSWGIIGAQFDAGINGTAVAVVGVGIDGGVARAAASAPSGATEAIGNGYFTCGFAPAVGSSVSLFGLAGIFALRLVRRRRR